MYCSRRPVADSTVQLKLTGYLGAVEEVRATSPALLDDVPQEPEGEGDGEVELPFAQRSCRTCSRRERSPLLLVQDDDGDDSAQLAIRNVVLEAFAQVSACLCLCLCLTTLPILAV